MKERTSVSKGCRIHFPPSFPVVLVISLERLVSVLSFTDHYFDRLYKLCDVFQLLQFNPAARLPLETVLNHEWIISHVQKDHEKQEYS